MGQIYDIERTVVDASREVRYEIRSGRSQVPDGSATAKALENSLPRWEELTRFLDDGNLPVDINHLEGQIRPIAVGKHNWLFAGSLRAGKRAAAMMIFLNSARLNPVRVAKL
jgi:transposase